MGPNPETGASAPARGKYDRTQSVDVRDGEQRLRLLAAAGAVIAERGYAATTVAAICESAGMSRRTFYEHFRDVRHIVLELHDFAANEAFNFVASRLQAIDDPVEQLREGVNAFLSLVAEHPYMARVVFREIRSVGPEYERRRELEIERYADLLRTGIDEAYRRNIVSRPSDPVVTYALIAAMEAASMRYLLDGNTALLPQAQATLADLILRAFL